MCQCVRVRRKNRAIKEGACVCVCVRTILKVNILRKIDSKVRNLAAYFDFSFSFAESCGKKREGGRGCEKDISSLLESCAEGKFWICCCCCCFFFFVSSYVCAFSLCFFVDDTLLESKKKKKKKKFEFSTFFPRLLAL